MTNENKDKIIDRVIDFLHNKPLKSDMRIAAALIEELKLVKNCSIPDVVGQSKQLVCDCSTCGTFDKCDCDNCLQYDRWRPKAN